VIFIKGKIFKIESKDYYVLLENNQEIRCSLKGKFKKIYSLKKNKLSILDVAAVGDFVEVEIADKNYGVISTIYERRNYLSRKAPKIKGATKRGERFEQIIAANVDNLFIVSSTTSPNFNNKLIDRIIVTALSSNIKPNIVINKSDLNHGFDINFWGNLYSELGYNLYYTSATEKSGIDEIRNVIHGKTNVFWGQSGVGKSSLINSLFPEFNLKVSKISEYSNKGRHTTVTSILKQIDETTAIIDTPGIREIEPYGIRKKDLGHYFKEFEKYILDCKFNTCTHTHEPKCAVIAALKNEEITIERYESYLNLLETIEDDMFFND